MLCWHLQQRSLQSLHCCCCWSDSKSDYRHVGCYCPDFYTAGTRDIIDRSGGGECPLSPLHSTPLHRLMGNSDTNIYLVPAQPMFTPPPVFGQWCVVATVLPRQCPVSSAHNPGKLDTRTRHSRRVAPRITPPPTDGHWRGGHYFPIPSHRHYVICPQW